MVGDVVFFKKTDSFISSLISKLTKSEFTHVGLVIAYDRSTKIATIIESNRFIKTKLTKIQICKDHVVYSIQDISEDMRNRIVKYSQNFIGVKYDYIQIIGLLLSLIIKGDRKFYFNSSNKLICSELIDLTFYKSGVPRKNQINIGNVTPQELLEVYALKENREEE